MAPEQVLGRRDQLGPTTDIYSLGVVLYELLSGNKPFEADSAFFLQQQIVQESAKPLPDSVPNQLVVICKQCLAKDPAERFQSAAELADLLRIFVSDGAAEPKQRTVDHRSMRYGPRLWLGGVEACVAITVLAIAFLSRLSTELDALEPWNASPGSQRMSQKATMEVLTGTNPTSTAIQVYALVDTGLPINWPDAAQLSVAATDAKKEMRWAPFPTRHDPVTDSQASQPISAAELSILHEWNWFYPSVQTASLAFTCHRPIVRKGTHRSTSALDDRCGPLFSSITAAVVSTHGIGKRYSTISSARLTQLKIRCRRVRFKNRGCSVSGRRKDFRRSTPFS